MFLCLFTLESLLASRKKIVIPINTLLIFYMNTTLFFFLSYCNQRWFFILANIGTKSPFGKLHGIEINAWFFHNQWFFKQKYVSYVVSKFICANEVLATSLWSINTTESNYHVTTNTNPFTFFYFLSIGFSSIFHPLFSQFRSQKWQFISFSRQADEFT